MKRFLGVAALTFAVLFSSQPIAEAGKTLQKPVITGVSVGSGGVDVTWQDGNNPKTGYDIERRELATGFAKIDSVLKAQTSYTDSTVAEGGTYYYRIRTFYEKSGSEQWSIYSEESQSVTVASGVRPSTVMKL